jgi:hypothetical protein
MRNFSTKNIVNTKPSFKFTKYSKMAYQDTGKMPFKNTRYPKVRIQEFNFRIQGIASGYFIILIH